MSQDLEVAPGPIADAPGSGGADAPLTRRLERSRWILAISLGGIALLCLWLLIDGGISLPWWANRGSAAPG